MKNIYNPIENESVIQKFWRENKFFKNNNSKKTFSMILPPPNVTGKLHLGHAWDSYYPDMLMRFKHLSGYKIYWFPGMDHAGIATQTKVEQEIYKNDKKTKFQFDREDFISKIWEWTDFYSKNIKNQWDKLGICLDYDKIKFTLDEDVNILVKKTFVNLYNENLIYKDKKIINWDPVLKTAISNIEINHIETESKIYNIKYKFENSNEFIVVATTRPETMFGDVALFINPNDNRYKKHINKYVINPLNNKKMIILSDEYVDMKFGTGVLKVTPAHDFFDYDLAKKYDLDVINIMNLDGTLNEKCTNWIGVDRFEARELIIDYFKKNDILFSIENYKNNIGFSERSGAIVEPMISNQWFLKSSILAKEAIKYQNDKTKKISFFPLRFEEIYKNWIKSMEDWCISRQLWWGHRIPVWYKDNEIKVQIDSPGKNWKQDEDVLDTWFSSSLWPIIFYDEKIMNNSDEKDSLSNTLFTGYDIIFFWISRMIFQSLKLLKKIPFKNVIVHGLIRDSFGKKMSKSLNNGIDPMNVINKWGSDSLRLFLLSSSTPGQDIKYNEKKINFAWDLNNKLFNAGNFLLTLINDQNFKRVSLNELNLTKIDNFILNKILIFKKNLEMNIEKYNLSFIFSEMNKLIFDDFSNNYLEFVKQDKNNEGQVFNAINIFIELLILLHALMPFNTENIYQKFKEKIPELNTSILQEKYLIMNQNEIILDKDIEVLMSVLKIARKIKSQHNFKKESLSEIFIKTDEKINYDFINKYISYLNSKVVKRNKNENNEINVFPGVGIIYSTYSNAKNKLNSQLIFELKKKIEFEFNRANDKLKNEKFVKNADASLIKLEKEKFKFYYDSLKIIK